MRDLIKSISYALAGINYALVAEKNFRLLWLLALALSVEICLFDFDLTKKIIFIILIFLVLALELINSAIEKCCDSTGLEANIFIKQAKDFAAGALLLIAIAAGIISALLFFKQGILYKPQKIISPALIILLNLLCFKTKLQSWRLIFSFGALFIHAYAVFNYSSETLFIILSLFFHLSLINSYIKKLLWQI